MKDFAPTLRWYAAIVALGVALALPGLDRIPLTQGDDATYFAVSRSLSLLLDWGWQRGWDGEAASAAEVLTARSRQQGIEFHLPYYSKPLFDLIYWTATAVWGAKAQAILYANLLFLRWRSGVWGGWANYSSGLGLACSRRSF